MGLESIAYVHEIKFFTQDNELYAALFDNPSLFCNEFWVKNIPAKELGVSKLPQNLKLEKKYKVEELGVKPFPADKPEFKFMDKVAEVAWAKGSELVLRYLP